MDIAKKKENLIEMLGMHFESLYSLPPLASRILGLLIVEGPYRGVTFEELVLRMRASKSSISTSLNLLHKLGRINYYTLTGDRKKYYKPSPFSDRLSTHLSIMNMEKDILNELLNYRQETATNADDDKNVQNLVAYKSHLLEVEELLTRTIDKFKQIEEKTKKNL